MIVFAGAQVALLTVAHALTNGHTHSIVFDPAYQSTQEAPLHAGSQVTRIALKAENGWQIDPQDVRNAVRENTRYMVINEPWNPGGTLMSCETQAELVAIAEQHGIYICSDEVYRLLEHDPKDRLPAMADAYSRGISCVTLSKPWGACGVTIGWLAFQDASIKQRLIDVQYLGRPAAVERANFRPSWCYAQATGSSPRIWRLSGAICACLRASCRGIANGLSGSRQRRAAIAFIRFKGPWDSNELGQRLAEAGIGIKPAYCFTDVVTPANDFFRVGYGEDRMPKALEALTTFVEMHRDEWRATRSRL